MIEHLQKWRTPKKLLKNCFEEKDNRASHGNGDIAIAEDISDCRNTVRDDLCTEPPFSDGISMECVRLKNGVNGCKDCNANNDATYVDATMHYLRAHRSDSAVAR